MMVTILLSYIAGIVSIFSPCVLPMIPVIFAGALGNWKRSVVIVIGMILFFMLAGTVASILGKVSLVRYLAYAGLFVFGVILVSDELYMKYSAFTSRFTGRLRVPADSFLFGAFLGLIWSPCIGPIVGALLGFNAISSGTFEGTISMLFFGLGIATGIAIILKLGERSKVFLKYGERIRKISGYIILIFLALLISGVYLQIELALSRLIPL
ncbi:cytochrome c biogenesis CcdA family protein [Geoglobus acetivorans]|uniref:Cytochrome c-type biogenesis protein CcdA n=1 Tax=Geoglobus acetivorans TaxID=565033 RepID=A0A0A7GF75_GEOAI|nr:cytochrome c-type biogenesis protein CcdA [Geoglobus acetivorans]